MLRPMVRPGDLAFDVGAHVGDRTRVLAALGARVVAVEPQPRLARFLRLAFRRQPRVTVVEAAVGARPGTLPLNVNTRNPTVSTASKALVAAAPRQAAWRREVWDEVVTVPVTTLDALIAEHGKPRFLKVDVEGMEDAVLEGLSTPVPALSFEFTTLQRDVASAALARAEALGHRRYNLSLGESHTMRFSAEVGAGRIARALADLPDEANSGDVYAFAPARSGLRSS